MITTCKFRFKKNIVVHIWLGFTRPHVILAVDEKKKGSSSLLASASICGCLPDHSFRSSRALYLALVASFEDGQYADFEEDIERVWEGRIDWGNLTKNIKKKLFRLTKKLLEEKS